MENLVSHEAMVKEIKNLCWDNRYREGMTVEHLAEELDALAEDFDPYEYRDNLLDEDNYIDEIIYDLNDGRYISEYMEFLQMVAEEDEDNSVITDGTEKPVYKEFITNDYYKRLNGTISPYKAKSTERAVRNETGIHVDYISMMAVFYKILFNGHYMDATVK